MEESRAQESLQRADLLRLLEDHHLITADHSKRVSLYTTQMAKFAGFSDEEVREIGKAALFHDIGKLHVPKHILDKQTIRTPEEIAIGNMHPLFGVQIAEQFNMSELTRILCAQHHERHDGSGYPSGLSGDDIHPAAQIIAYVDSFDAATTRAWNGVTKSEDEIYHELIRSSGAQYSPHFRDAFEEFYQWHMWNHY